jgi:hypothetical protein
MVWTLIGEAFKYSNKRSAEINSDVSLMDYIKENVEQQLRKRLKIGLEGAAYAVCSSHISFPQDV